jgi:hypothetical protein
MSTQPLCLTPPIRSMTTIVPSSHLTLVLPAVQAFLFQPRPFASAVFNLKTKDSIADSGATQIFLMDGTPVVNKWKTTCPLRVALADGRVVTSTHMCDIHIKGLPITLRGHIIPELSVASLFGIHVLTAARCKVRFDNLNCTV